MAETWKLATLLKAFLRALGLDPIDWAEATTLAGPGVRNIFEIASAAFANAQAVIVFMTGDDLARLGTRYVRPADPLDEKQLTPQPRPNVLFEAGYAVAKFPERTIIASLGDSSEIQQPGGG